MSATQDKPKALHCLIPMPDVGVVMIFDLDMFDKKDVYHIKVSVKRFDQFYLKPLCEKFDTFSDKSDYEDRLQEMHDIGYSFGDYESDDDEKDMTAERKYAIALLAKIQKKHKETDYIDIISSCSACLIETSFKALYQTALKEPSKILDDLI